MEGGLTGGLVLAQLPCGSYREGVSHFMDRAHGGTWGRVLLIKSPAAARSLECTWHGGVDC